MYALARDFIFRFGRAADFANLDNLGDALRAMHARRCEECAAVRLRELRESARKTMHRYARPFKQPTDFASLERAHVVTPAN
jgi:hypothetical protein